MYPLHPEPPSNLPPHPLLPSCPRAPVLGALLIKITFLLHCSLLSVQYIALCLKKVHTLISKHSITENAKTTATVTSKITEHRSP